MENANAFLDGVKRIHMDPEKPPPPWDPQLLPVMERERFLTTYGFDPVNDWRQNPHSGCEYKKYFTWIGEPSLVKMGVQVGGVVFFGTEEHASGVLVQFRDHPRLLLLHDIFRHGDQILEISQNDAQDPPWPELTSLVSPDGGRLPPWEAFARLVAIVNRIATEGLRSLNPNLVPASLNAALVRAIALAIRDLVPEAVTLSPRGIAVGGALVHPFLAPAPRPPGHDWFLSQMLRLAAVEGEIARTSRPEPRQQPKTWEALSTYLDTILEDMRRAGAPDRIRPKEEVPRVLAAARDALLQPGIAPAWAWAVIARARLLQIKLGLVRGAPAFGTFAAAWTFIQRRHLAAYMDTDDDVRATIEDAARAEAESGAAGIPTWRGDVEEFLREWRETQNTRCGESAFGYDQVVDSGKLWRAAPPVLEEFAKAFRYARRANLMRWFFPKDRELAALEAKCQPTGAGGPPVEFSDAEMRLLTQLRELVPDLGELQNEVQQDVTQAMQKKFRVGTTRAAMHAIQLAPRLAEAWTPLARVCGYASACYLHLDAETKPRVTRLLGRVRGRRHAQVTEVLCGGDDELTTTARACCETATYLDATCADAWALLARLQGEPEGAETCRLALEILPASRLLQAELQYHLAEQQNPEQGRDQVRENFLW